MAQLSCPGSMASAARPSINGSIVTPRIPSAAWRIEAVHPTAEPMRCRSRLNKLLLRPITYLSIVIGSWITILVISQCNWAHDHNRYDDIFIRIALAGLFGVFWGIANFSFWIPIIHKVSKSEIERTHLIKCFSLAHLPFYLLWLYVFDLEFKTTGPINRYLPYIVVFGFLCCSYFLLKNNNSYRLLRTSFSYALTSSSHSLPGTFCFVQ